MPEIVVPAAIGSRVVLSSTVLSQKASAGPAMADILLARPLFAATNGADTHRSRAASGFDGMFPAVTLASAATMLKAGVPIVKGYFADALTNQATALTNQVVAAANGNSAH